jgi:outer membrane protein assembly factor BamB
LPSSSAPLFKRIPISIWIGTGALLLIPVARWFLDDIDHQYSNIATAALSAIGLLSITFGILRRLPKKATFVYLLAVGISVAGFLACFEFRGFTGELVPTFRWRFPVSDSTDKTIADRTWSDANRDEHLARLEPWIAQARFTQFLGNERNGIVDSPTLDLDWSDRKPEILWRVPMGDGWSGVTVADGRVWTLFQEELREVVVCYELSTGKELWRTGFDGLHTEPMGGTGPRATATWQAGKLWIQTAVGIAACLDAKTGVIHWQKDLLREGFQDQSESEQSIKWGRSGSPLLVNASGQLLVIFPLGGKRDAKQGISLLALDAHDGTLKWKTGSSQIAYGSPVLMNIGGSMQVVAINEGSVTGHAVETGEILWTSPWASLSNADACSSSPVACSTDRILLGKGYAAGSKMIRVAHREEDGKSVWSTEDVWLNHRVLKTKLTNAIFSNDRLFALSDGILECVDPETGKRIWRGGRYGQGQLLVVNDRLLVSAEDGRLIVVEPEQGKELHSVELLEGVTWNYPAVAGPFLLMRNSSEMVCLFSPRQTPDLEGATLP